MPSDLSPGPFAVQDCSFLLRFRPKLVVVACNTVSAIALDRLRTLSDAMGGARPDALDHQEQDREHDQYAQLPRPMLRQHADHVQDALLRLIRRVPPRACRADRLATGG